jgi:hypothetical protein
MQFKPELMREILLFLESLPAEKIFQGSIAVDGYPQPEVNLHILLLSEEGYFMNPKIQSDEKNLPRIFVIPALSMKAHEFLANARNNTVWKKVLAKAKAEGSSVSISILNGMLSKAAQKYAGLDD